ncbi:MAG: DUF1638 domain-containing protein [Methanomassiliicoccales archaeon]|nr:DUF1638 domain-containing protein [Methanomassiliicoccales archaeon]
MARMLGKGDCLGIIGCTVLQDELIHVLRRDNELKHLAIIESEVGARFVERAKPKLAHLDLEMVHLSELESFRDRNGFTVILDIKTTSLHRDPDAFRKEVILTCHRMRSYVDGVLLFYGLCRNALRKMGKVSEEVGMPVTILKDALGREVDDCFGALMGGRVAYLEHMADHRGTMFIIPGYAELWYGKLGSKDVEKALEAYQSLKFVFERCGYTKLLRLDTHLCDQEEFERRVDTFARMFDMQLSSEEADLSVFDSSYAMAKRMAQGDYRECSSQTEPPTIPTSLQPF